jgi:hypothetical protein
MSERDLRLLMEAVAEATDDWFKQKGIVPPTWCVIDSQGETRTIPSLSDSKDVAVALVRSLLELIGARRYCFVDEAWMLDRRDTPSTPEAEAEIKAVHERGIADHPERIEIVMFSGEDIECGQLMAHRVIHRPKGKRAYLGPLEWPLSERGVQSEGRMVGLLPRHGATQ